VADHRTNPEASTPVPVRSPEGRRKTYQRPQILSREPLESMAATCTGNNAKAISGVGGCKGSGSNIKS
jgi:hypothetical protein